MDEMKSIVSISKYGHIEVCLADVMDKRGITRNKLRTLTGVKYEVIDRYYKATNVERVDLDFLAKVCFVLDCDINDILQYHKSS